MGNGEKKWDATAERDLCISLIMSTTNDGKASYNWPQVTLSMEALGHAFTKDAMSQHFSKVICKDFKTRRGDLPDTPAKTPRKRKAAASKLDGDDDLGGGETPKKTPAAKRKATAAAKIRAEEGDGDAQDGAGGTPKKTATPRKRRAKKAPVSEETVDDSPAAESSEEAKTAVAKTDDKPVEETDSNEVSADGDTIFN
ncbi:hypothetical protein CP533_1025 [Ophiocordyceps camponoti-saundersi (nom. inval.)]|nr:hypothetical protein CP533_1025 [Ophiocordyceps camponoti-saundersi (nom. inval.)]